MATSRLPDAIDTLYNRWKAAPGLGAAGVSVYDGPVVTDDALRESVWVGFNADPNGTFQVAETSQDWAGIGAKKRQEEFGVICAVYVPRGDTDIRKARERAYEIFGAVEADLRSDPSLGFPPPTVVSLTDVTVFQEPTTSGIQVRLVFIVQFRTRI